MVAKIKNNMSDVRREVWANKMDKAKVASELKSTPPTTEAFHETLKRGHIIQASI